MIEAWVGKPKMTGSTLDPQFPYIKTVNVKNVTSRESHTSNVLRYSTQLSASTLHIDIIHLIYALLKLSGMDVTE